MPFACIFVPDFPVQALLRAEPELRSQAVAVLEGKAPLQVIFALNENARRAGVMPGMTKLQVEACPEITLRCRSPLQEAVAHAVLLEGARSFSPLLEDSGCNIVLLDLAGLELLFGSLLKIARAIANRASDLGLEANVAVASNPHTAMLAARGFPGVTIIPAGEEAERLGDLPLDVLLASVSDFPQEQEAAQFSETFRRWGIRNLRALAALPELGISERLGQEGLRLQQMARGATCRKLVPFEPPSAFEEAVELEYPLVLLEPLAFLLNRLLERLCARLEAQASATQELRLQLELDPNFHSDESGDSRAGVVSSSPGTTCFHRTLRLPVPLLDSKTFLKLLQLDLKAHPPGAPIRKIRLGAEPARPRAAQGGLFLPASPEPEKLELTLARIAGIVGEEKSGSVELLDTHRPEGFRMQRFAPLPAPAKPAPRARRNGSDQPRDFVTALRLFRPPARVTVTMREGVPAHLANSTHKQLGGRILWAAGPWRSSGDWWEKQAWARDEWDIAVEGETSITLYRLIRDLLSGQWLVEGTYD
jgi:protein ImuB